MRFIVASVLALSLLSAAGERAAFSQDASPQPTPAPTKASTPPPIGTTDSQIATTTLTALDTPTTVTYLTWAGLKADNPYAPITPPPSFPSFGRDICTTDAPCAKNRNLYIIHLVDWTADNGEINLGSSQWFLYRFDTKTGYTRINPQGNSFPSVYDIDNGVLMSISRLKIGFTDAGSAALMPPPLDNTITVAHTTPTWLAGLQTLVGSLTGVKIGAAAGPPNGQPIYKTTITMRVLSGDDTARPFTIQIASAATGPKDTGPSDCMKLSKTAKCNFTFSATVAQREFVSFGLNIVPYGPVERQYYVANPDSKTQIGTLTVNPDRHDAVYAVVDFFPFGFLPKDTTNYPYLQTGLPVTGAALRMPYVGMAQHIPFTEKFLSISAFGGVVFMKQSRPKTLQPGAMITNDQLTADLFTNRAIKILWGFEVPISSFASAISGHKFK
jgi:hypothetical protein